MNERPNNWNALQVTILRGLAEGKTGTFDRWNRLCLDGQPMTSGHSTTPYTLFRRGLIVSDGETVYLTDRGVSFLTETFGLSFELLGATIKLSKA